MKKYTDNIKRYVDARKDIKNGDIVFMAGSNSFFGKLIQFVTKSPIYHVGIACWMVAPSGERILCSVEQWYGGRRIVNLRTFSRSSLIVVKNPIVDFNRYSGELLGNTGDDYGNMDFIGAGLHDMFGIKSKNYSGEMCSEMIMRIINNTLKLTAPHYTVISPQKLFEVLTDTFACDVVLQTEPE